MAETESSTSNEGSSMNGERGAATGAARSFGERIDRVSDGAQQAWSSTREAVAEVRDRLDIEGRVRRHPYGMVAAAVGIGYVLGGGIFSRLTARILGLGLKVGIRMAAIPFIKDEVLGLVEAAAGGEGIEGQGQGQGQRQRGGRRASPRQR
jgi:hypothetical protein